MKFFTRTKKEYRKEIEEKNQNLIQYKLALDNISDQVTITNNEGNIVYANNALEKITGFSHKEVIGKKAGASYLWGGHMSSDFYKKMWKTIKEEKKVFRGEIKNKRKNGEFYIAEVSISPVLNAKKEILFFVAVERDISEQKNIDKAKSEFVSLASHQLRTPLSVVRWYSEMLSDEYVGKLNKKQKEYLKEVENGNKRMISLVNSLLNVSRIELGTFKIDPIELDFKKEAEEILNEMKILAEKNNVELSSEFEDNLPKIKMDKDLLDIIYQNILSNSIKYTQEKGKVKLSVFKKDKNVIIEVSDNGYGIPENQKDKIFTKLFRADNIQSKDVEGTGLGLYIMKSVIDNVGGKVSFDSKEGEGTTFRVELPLEGVKKQKSSIKLI